MFAPQTPPPGVFFLALLMAVFIMTTGCSGPVVGGLSGKDTIMIINATRHLSPDGLVSNMYECAYYALDTSNSGSGSHRSR